MAITASALTSTAFLTSMFYGSMAAAVASIGTGIYSSIRQSQQQAAQAKYQEQQSRQQAAIQEQNAQLAENQASAQRKSAYDKRLADRRKAEDLITRQRAVAGMSGATVDFGSFADVADDTAARAAIDIDSAYYNNLDDSYNTEMQAWNYQQQAAGLRTQADAYGAQASAARSAGIAGAIGTAAGGIAQLGNTWAGYAAKKPGDTGAGNYDAFKDWYYEDALTAV